MIKADCLQAKKSKFFKKESKSPSGPPIVEAVIVDASFMVETDSLEIHMSMPSEVQCSHNNVNLTRVPLESNYLSIKNTVASRRVFLLPSIL